MIDTGRAVQFIIRLKAEQRDVGSVYLRDIDKKTGTAEFGIFIGEEECLGKGIGQEAAGLILAYGFNKLKLRRIFLRVFADNQRAIASYRKAGFIEMADGDEEIKPQLKDSRHKIVFMVKEGGVS